MFQSSLWCWKRLLRVPWTARSNQSILKETSPEYSLEGLMLKLKLQHFGHLIRRADSLKKTMMLGKIEGGKTRGWQRMRWLVGITDLMDMSLSKLEQDGEGQGSLACCSPWGCKELDTTEQLNNNKAWDTESPCPWASVFPRDACMLPKRLTPSPRSERPSPSPGSCHPPLHLHPKIFFHFLVKFLGSISQWTPEGS